MTPQPNCPSEPSRHAAHLPDEGPADAPDAAALATDEPPCVDEALGDAGQLGPPGSSRGAAAPSEAPSSSQPQGQAPAPPCAASPAHAPGACRAPCAAPAQLTRLPQISAVPLCMAARSCYAGPH